MTEPSSTILSIHELRAGYTEVDILQGVTLDITRGDMVSIIGPNGAGKSTLLKVVYGLVRPRSGSVVFRAKSGEEHEIAGRKPHQITTLGMNYVPQIANVFQAMAVHENLEIGACQLTPRECRSRIERCYEWFPKLADRRKQRAGTLSGGERQMLGLARALITDPDLVFLDEPSAALSPVAVDELFEKLVDINKSGITIVLVEQNARRSLAISDFGCVLELGVTKYTGTGAELLHDEKVVDLYLGGRGRFGSARLNPTELKAAEG